MVDEFEPEAEPRPHRVPAWYWLGAIACLLFELAGCYAYYLQVTTDPATLPVDQRRLSEAMPMLVTAFYAAAVWIGLAGAILLLVRSLWARRALVVSLVFVVLQFGGIMAVPELREGMSSDQLLGPILIILLAYGFWQFAVVADKKDWIE